MEELVPEANATTISSVCLSFLSALNLTLRMKRKKIHDFHKNLSLQFFEIKYLADIRMNSP